MNPSGEKMSLLVNCLPTEWFCYTHTLQTCNRKTEATVPYFEDWPSVCMCSNGLTLFVFQQNGNCSSSRSCFAD